MLHGHALKKILNFAHMELIVQINELNKAMGNNYMLLIIYPFSLKFGPTLYLYAENFSPAKLNSE